MYFNSIAYAIFLPIVFIVYWLIQYRTVKIQNAFILFSSYVFYGWWDPRFLSLILISSVTDYIIGIKLENEIESPKRKLLLLISVSVNIGLLFIFKYFGFFVNSFAQLLSRAGIEPNIARSSMLVFIIRYSLHYGFEFDLLIPARNLITSLFPQSLANSKTHHWVKGDGFL